MSGLLPSGSSHSSQTSSAFSLPASSSSFASTRVAHSSDGQRRSAGLRSHARGVHLNEYGISREQGTRGAGNPHRMPAPPDLPGIEARVRIFHCLTGGADARQRIPRRSSSRSRHSRGSAMRCGPARDAIFLPMFCPLLSAIGAHCPAFTRHSLPHVRRTLPSVQVEVAHGALPLHAGRASAAVRAGRVRDPRAW